MIALEACGVGAGDEVITPALSWVASASAALAINAVPVLADVDPDTLCLDPANVEALVTERTKAMIVVHLYSAVADLDGLLAVARKHGLRVIEDCSQAHGARYRGRNVGTFGTAGIFSMHETKVLTCGEGGAAITDNPDVARAMQRLRADGREHRPDAVDGEWSLIEAGRPMGGNMALSEIQAAILSAQLPLLDAQIDCRNRALERLSHRFAGTGITLQSSAVGTDRRSPFGLPIHIPEGARTRLGPRELAEQLWSKLRVPVRLPYRSIGKSPLYDPQSRARFRIGSGHLERVSAAMRTFTPHADRVAETTIVLPHPVLLAKDEALDTLADALIAALDPA